MKRSVAGLAVGDERGGVRRSSPVVMRRVRGLVAVVVLQLGCVALPSSSSSGSATTRRTLPGTVAAVAASSTSHLYRQLVLGSSTPQRVVLRDAKGREHLVQRAALVDDLRSHPRGATWLATIAPGRVKTLFSYDAKANSVRALATIPGAYRASASKDLQRLARSRFENPDSMVNAIDEVRLVDRGVTTRLGSVAHESGESLVFTSSDDIVVGHRLSNDCVVSLFASPTFRLETCPVPRSEIVVRDVGPAVAMLVLASCRDALDAAITRRDGTFSPVRVRDGRATISEAQTGRNPTSACDFGGMAVSDPASRSAQIVVF